MNLAIKFIGTILVMLLLVLLAAILIPLLQPKHVHYRNLCVTNLRSLDGLKEQWALEHHKKPGDRIAVDLLEPDYRQSLDRALSPGCPGGGTYTLDPIGSPPTCSLGVTNASHRLPTR